MDAKKKGLKALHPVRPIPRDLMHPNIRQVSWLEYHHPSAIFPSFLSDFAKSEPLPDSSPTVTRSHRP